MQTGLEAIAYVPQYLLNKYQMKNKLKKAKQKKEKICSLYCNL